ncbi:MAG: VTT domain-containing protein [Bacilli bacterium]
MLEQLLTELSDHTILLFCIGFLITAAESVFPPLPLTAIVLWNSFALGGILGYIASISGALIGGGIVYTVASFWQDRLPNRLKNSKLNVWVERQSWWLYAIAYAMPIIPHTLLSIAGGLYGVSWRKLFSAMLLGKSVLFVALGLFGTNVERFFQNPRLLLILLPICIVFFFLSKKFKDRVEQ